MTWGWQWYNFALVMGSICSANWKYTAGSFVLITVTTWLYYALMFELFDYVALIQAILTSAVLAYATYNQEKTKVQMIF